MYITYKVVCKVTNKSYIGSHKTDVLDDGYMGSGRLIAESVLKYGIENHYKEILGIFETRKESTDLEHKLIKELKHKQPDNCLNLTCGGESFDYINNNLTFDRAAFGKLTPHTYSKELKENNTRKYNLSPKHCVECGAVIPYEKRGNKFCSSSCSARHNNKLRGRYKSEYRVCPQCGNKFLVEKSSEKRFCNTRCAGKYISVQKKLQNLKQRLEKDIETIRRRHQTESFRQIAKDYGVSGNCIKHLLKDNK